MVDIIDDAIRQIRASIFQLRPRTLLGGVSLRSAVLDRRRRRRRPSLGWEPPVVFAGAVDSVSDEALVDDVAAVVRESLSNVARHAQAHHAEVSVTVRGPLLEVVVEDDGVGVGETAPPQRPRQPAPAGGGPLGHLRGRAGPTTAAAPA